MLAWWSQKATCINRTAEWLTTAACSRHMHKSKAIKPFKHLSHCLLVVQQIHHQAPQAYAAIRRLLYCPCLSDVRQCLHPCKHTPRFTSEGSLMKASYVTGNWIFGPVSCLLQSKADLSRLSSHTETHKSSVSNENVFIIRVPFFASLLLCPLLIQEQPAEKSPHRLEAFCQVTHTKSSGKKDASAPHRDLTRPKKV